MTARALTTAAASWWACVLLAGCSTIGSQKPAEGFTAEDRKFFREAEAHLDGGAAPKGDKQTESFLAMGQFYMEVKKTSLAERMFEKAIASDPKSVAAYAGLAKCHAESGRTDKAAEALNKGFAVDAKSPVLWNEAAVLRARTGDMDGAVEAAERAMTAAPNVTLYAENLGNLLVASGKYKRAFEVYSKSVGPAEGHYRIGVLLREKGDLRNAEHHLKEALALQPDHAAARRVLAATNAAPRTDPAVQPASYEAPEEQEPAVKPATQPPRTMKRTTTPPRSTSRPGATTRSRSTTPQWAPKQ